MDAASYLACDLGAESGRCILGHVADGRLTLEEIHRFPNGPVRFGATLRWDLVRLFTELKIGLGKALAAMPTLRSLSVDTWGVDYVWHNARQPVLGLPYCYRDQRNEPASEKVVQRLGQAAIFGETGIQFLPFNTLYQFSADLETNLDLLRLADGFLLVADFLNYLFGGAPVAERSLASTTQMYHPGRHEWSAELCTAIGLPTRLLPALVQAGDRIGTLRPEIAADLGVADPKTSVAIVATCSHDTGAAVAAVPAGDGASDWAFLVSGTWSLLGVELASPLINDDVRKSNFTNEVGFGGSIRFLTNIAGLWLLQEARRDYARSGESFDYPVIVQQAAAAGPANAFIRPEAARFARPGAMLEKIAAYCRETGQQAPETPGEYFRCILESLALVYRQKLLEAERLTDRALRTLHIVGGGSQNALLNQFTADATGRTVVVGPVEATAIGNVLVQAIADGRLGSLGELRAVVARSFPLITLQPRDPDRWQEAAERFAGLDLLT